MRVKLSSDLDKTNECILCLRVNPSSWKQQNIDPTTRSIQQSLPWYKFRKLYLKDTLNTAMKAFEENIEELNPNTTLSTYVKKYTGSKKT